MLDMKYGVKQSVQDDRDHCIAAAVPMLETYPDEYSIPVVIDTIYNQLNTSMCVAFSLKRIKEYQELNERGRYIPLSAGFIYTDRYFEDVDYDLLSEGMCPREALKRLKADGVCTEKTFNWMGNWQDVGRSLITQQMEDEAKPFRILSYAACSNDNEIKAALMHTGAVLGSIPVTKKFVGDYNEPITRKYAEDPKNLYGYHAITIVGWVVKDEVTYWKCVNSYGKEWGNYEGYFFLPLGYPFAEVWAITDYVEPIKPNKPKYWHVQVGSFSSKSDAYDLSLKLKQAKYPTYIVNIGGLWKVQIGAFADQGNAAILEAKLKQDGREVTVSYY